MMNITMYIGLFVTMLLAIIAGQIFNVWLLTSKWYTNWVFKKTLENTKEPIIKWTEELTTELNEAE